jgi:hypothetical protein
LGRKTEQKKLKNVKFGQERIMLKVDDKESMVVKEISTIKMKPNTCHWNNKKDTLRTSLEVARHQTS